jgi:hypothetical protein
MRPSGRPSAALFASLALISGTPPPYSRVHPADLGVVVVKRGSQEAPAPERWSAAEGTKDAETGARACCLTGAH